MTSEVQERRVQIGTGRQKRSDFLVLTTFYQPGIDRPLPRLTDKVFVGPEVFAKGQNPYPFAVFAPFTNALDVQRTKQAQVFGTPETFGQPLRQALVTTLTSYVAYVPGTDVRFGKNTQVFSVPETFPQALTQEALIINGTAAAPAYNQATDVRFGKFAQVFGTPETFIQALAPEALIINGNGPTSVVRSQDNSFWINTPDYQGLFTQKQTIVFLTQYAVYVPGTDTKRTGQTLVFGSPEVFAQGLPFAPLVINGSAAQLVSDPTMLSSTVNYVSTKLAWSQAQKPSPLVFNGTVAALPDFTKSLQVSQRNVVLTNKSNWSQPQKGSLVVTLGVRESSDVFYSQDVRGWPDIPEQRFIQPWTSRVQSVQNSAVLWISDGGIAFAGTAAQSNVMKPVSTGGIVFGGAAIYQSVGQSTAGKRKGRRRLFNLMRHHQ